MSLSKEDIKAVVAYRKVKSCATVSVRILTVLCWKPHGECIVSLPHADILVV